MTNQSDLRNACVMCFVLGFVSALACVWVNDTQPETKRETREDSRLVDGLLAVPPVLDTIEKHQLDIRSMKRRLDIIESSIIQVERLPLNDLFDDTGF